MGAAGSKKFLEQPNWNAYINGDWRSERMLELDKLGGMHRVAIPRGGSFSAKLQLLEISLKAQGDKMQESLTPMTPMEKAEVETASTGFHFHTASRAAKRSGIDPEEINQLRAASEPGKPAAPASCFLYPSGTSAALRKEALLQKGLLRAPRAAPSVPAPTHVADWRLHMHQARRRVVLMVRVMILLRRRTKLVKRPARVDGLAFIVPLALGDDKSRFVEEVAKYEALKAEVDLLKALTHDHLGAVAGLLEVGLSPRAPRSSHLPMPLPAPHHAPPLPPLEGVPTPHAWPRDVRSPPLPSTRPLLGTGHSVPAPGRTDRRASHDLLSLAGGPGSHSAPTSPYLAASIGARSLQAQHQQHHGPLGHLDPRATRLDRTSSGGLPTALPDPLAAAAGGVRPMLNSPLQPASRNHPAHAPLPRIRRETTSNDSPYASSHSPTSPVIGGAAKALAAKHQDGRQAAIAKQSLHLLQMYVNRYSTVWSEAQLWSCPNALLTEVSDTFLLSEQYTIYKADALRKLRNGQIALQVFCGDDYIRLSDGTWQDLWTADPWLLVDGCRPGLMPLTEHIEGVSLGLRVLCQLVQQLVALAGPEALAAMIVILHVDDKQQQDVFDDLWAHNFLGLSRSNVLLVVQQQQPGHRYNPAEQMFSLDSGEEAQGGTHGTLGTGWGLLQMQWANEAQVMDDGGGVVALPLSVFEVLAQHKVEWLMTRRSRDLTLLSRGDGVLSITQLAYTLSLRDKAQASIVTEMMVTESLTVSRAYDSILLRRTSPAAVEAPATPGSPPAMPTSSVVELRLTEVVPSRLNDCRSPDGTVAVGLQRYMLHVPTMKGVVSSPAVFRPKLALNEQLVQVSLDLADLTACEKVRHVAVRGGSHHGMLCSADDVDVLVPLVQNQDRDVDFRALLMKCSAPADGGDDDRLQRSERPDLKMVGARGALGPSGRTLLVLVADNNVSLAAVHMASITARAGKDHIKFVTFLATEFQTSEGEALMLRMTQAAQKATLADVLTECVVRGPSGVVDCIERYVETTQPDMVFMGSNALTSGATNVLISSVTLAAVKRLLVPVVVVTANSARYTSGFKTLRTLAIVEAHAKPLLQHLCSNMLEHKRGDRLVLGQVLLTRHQTRQQEFNHRRLMDLFSHLAASLHLSPSNHVTLDGVFEKAVTEGVEDNKVCLLGVQLPQIMRSIPPHVIALLRASKAAVLLVKGHAAGRSTVASLEESLGSGVSSVHVEAGL